MRSTPLARAARAAAMVWIAAIPTGLATPASAASAGGGAGGRFAGGSPAGGILAADVLTGDSGASGGGVGGLPTGADLSDLEAIETAGGTFRDSAGGAPRDAMAILRDRGVNAVRLRLWHTPPGGACDLASTTRLAGRARALGMEVLLDLHYSDTWADPGHQTPPAAWRGLAGRSLEDSVRLWTRDVMRSLAASGASPGWVQIGNEVSAGLLWPAGRIAGPADRSERWDRFAALMRAAADGVREGSRPPRGGRGGSAARAGAAEPGGGPAARPRIVVHVDHGGDSARTTAFFERLRRSGVGFDAAAVSYYPWWHGGTRDLERTLRGLAAAGHDVMVAETAFPWSLGWFDATHNVVGDAARFAGGPAPSPEAQAAFVREVRAVVARIPRGRGLFYWGAAEISAPRRGSSWENAALFDSAGRVLPAAAALGGVPASR